MLTFMLFKIRLNYLQFCWIMIACWNIFVWWKEFIDNYHVLSKRECSWLNFLTDKLKRTALTHAVMNGNTNVASYLLYLGADPNHADSSGNTLVHYAAAYGWYHCLKLLVKDAGANVSIENDWKVNDTVFKWMSILFCFKSKLLFFINVGWSGIFAAVP